MSGVSIMKITHTKSSSDLSTVETGHPGNQSQQQHSLSGCWIQQQLQLIVVDPMTDQIVVFVTFWGGDSIFSLTFLIGSN
jgi:hypothetical protein